MNKKQARDSWLRNDASRLSNDEQERQKRKDLLIGVLMLPTLTIALVVGMAWLSR